MSDYERIADIIDYLDQHHAEQPSLATLAKRARLSTFHFHRLFTRWAGITPKDFLQCLTLSHARSLLNDGKDVLSASLDAGLSGPGRLHDLCVTLEAASPGELKSGGAGWTIQAGFAQTPFGWSLLGESPRGITHLSFVDTADRREGAALIQRQWPRATIQWNDSTASRLADTIFQPSSSSGWRAFVRGTAFQVRVWRALLQIPTGSLVSYGDLAAALGNSDAARAVGTAVGQNPIAYLIPCHRVIRETGALGGYRWGITRKRAILAWEKAQR